VFDDWTRECLAIEVGRSLTGRNVIAVLDKAALAQSTKLRFSLVEK
jgi:hypothetical protein